jgi:hypothetical protein
MSDGISAPLTPVFCTQQGLADLADKERERIVCVTHFSGQYVAAEKPAEDGFMSIQMAIPAIVSHEEDLVCEVKLAAAGTTVDYSHWVEPGLGIVEESRFDEQRLLRLTLREQDHRNLHSGSGGQVVGHDEAPLRNAAFAGYSYLFRRQRSESWTALRYTNYVRGVIDVDGNYANLAEGVVGAMHDGTYAVPPGQRYVSFNHGRFDAWEQSGPKRISGLVEPCYEPAAGRSWRPVCPAATGIGTKDGDLIIEAWYTSLPEIRVSYVENARQTPAFRYDTRYGRKPPVFARGTYVETASGAGVIVSGTASILQSEIVHDPTPALQGVSEATRSSILEDCLRRQFALTIENIGYLLSGSNLDPQGVCASFDLEDLSGLRIYIKHPEHVRAAREEADRLLPSGLSLMFVENHICRPGWLLEIEGLAWKSRGQASSST